MAREIIRPEYGQPVIFKLGNAPTLVEGIRGPQWRYFVNEDSAMLYLDEPAKAAIDKLQPGPNAEICLRKERVGRATHWAADLIEEEPAIVDGEFVTPSLQATRARYEERREASREPEWVSQPQFSPDPPAPTKPPTVFPQRKPKAASNGNSNGHSNGNGHHAPPPAAAPPPEQPAATPPHRPGAKMLAMALFAAIDAAKLAQDYAQSHGMKLQFASEDIRAMAATLYIDQRKEAR